MKRITPFLFFVLFSYSLVFGVEVLPTSLVSQDGNQRILFTGWDAEKLGTPAAVTVYDAEKKIVLAQGTVEKETQFPTLTESNPSPAFYTMIPEQKSESGTDACWELRDSEGKILQTLSSRWDAPRRWTIYMVSSTHCDIGLHNSQYIQRNMSVQYAALAAELADRTNDWSDASKYRYMMEGTWFWGNYEQDRSESEAQKYVEKYVKTGRIAIGCTPAGNHTQTYGFEELCRSAYKKQMLSDRWGIEADTMVMSDNNGIIWSLVTPYAEAGIRNILFSPNQWNPLPSTIWPMNQLVEGATWNPDAGGGGSRVDVRWDSPLPMVFYWESANAQDRLLVWCSTQYGMGGDAFGVERKAKQNYVRMEHRMARHLHKLEGRYPFDVWVFALYMDDEAPNLNLATAAKEWNARWASPTLRTVGNLSEPFNLLRERFDAQIPVLRGDITCGWAQHPVCAPELLALKFEADRALPSAEKAATAAALVNPAYVYPSVEFRRAWDMLIWNDEHSYGTSGYKGRRVYETWIQHRDWIEKAQNTAKNETKRAMDAIAERISVEENSVLIFNPTFIPRREIVETTLADGRRVRFRTPEVPPTSWISVPVSEIQDVPRAEEESLKEPPEANEPATTKEPETTNEPPTVENAFYRVTFAPDGSVKSLFDKELKRELIDLSAKYKVNQFVYTQNNHKTFSTPENASFTVRRDALGTMVFVRTSETQSQAEIIQTIFLPNDEKWISFDNQMNHVRDLINKNRYFRYGYYAFPFNIQNGKFHVELNGVFAEPKRNVTGHGTDVYMAARDFAGVQNDEFGVELIQLDSQLLEFGRISPDKTDFGRPLETTHLYSYVFTDWLQMHATGGSYVNPRFRYIITSHAGTFSDAQTARLAERFTTPLLTANIPAGPKNEAFSSISASISAPVLPPAPSNFQYLAPPKSSNLTLLTFKQAEKPGSGCIVRIHETDGKTAFYPTSDAPLEKCTITEQSLEPLPLNQNVEIKPYDYLTFRFPAFTSNPLDASNPSEGVENLASLESVSGFHVVEAGDDCVKLAWEKISHPLAHYLIFRGSFDEFKPDEFHLVKRTTENAFCDKNRDPGTTYFYRIQPIAGFESGKPSDVLRVSTLEPSSTLDSPPAPIGSVYTGLVTAPRAAAGEDPDLLYLEWGQNQESDLAFYELYRSTESGFLPNEQTFVTRVEPGVYRVGLHPDRGLEVHTTYFYRVRAVDAAGNRGPFSEEFSGTTKEPIP